MNKKKFIKKVERYITLSKEFEMDKSKLFKESAVVSSDYSLHGTVTINSSCTSSSYSGSIGGCQVSVETKTRAEVILEKAKYEADRSDRHDEYLKLRQDICSYIDIIKTY
jgi:hypothetical protein